MQRHSKTRTDAQPDDRSLGGHIRRFAKRSARKLRAFGRNLLFPQPDQGNLTKRGADPTVVDPLIIKAQIPQSWFTKSGPGVTKNARRVFLAFTPAQREYAMMRGWFPAAWRQSEKHQRELRAMLEAAKS